MPSSPLAPPASPPARDLVEFLGGSRTLEWACAAARLAGKEGRRRPRARERDLDWDKKRDGDGGRGDAGEETEEDDVEAVTPEGSLGASDAARWHGHARPHPRLAFTCPRDSVPEGDDGKWPYVERPGKDVPEDEDRMRAALALCGLGRTSG